MLDRNGRNGLDRCQPVSIASKWVCRQSGASLTDFLERIDIFFPDRAAVLSTPTIPLMGREQALSPLAEERSGIVFANIKSLNPPIGSPAPSAELGTPYRIQ